MQERAWAAPTPAARARRVREQLVPCACRVHAVLRQHRSSRSVAASLEPGAQEENLLRSDRVCVQAPKSEDALVASPSATDRRGRAGSIDVSNQLLHRGCASRRRAQLRHRSTTKLPASRPARAKRREGPGGWQRLRWQPTPATCRGQRRGCCCCGACRVNHTAGKILSVKPSLFGRRWVRRYKPRARRRRDG